MLGFKVPKAGINGFSCHLMNRYTSLKNPHILLLDILDPGRNFDSSSEQS